jgi:inosine/xanthosine triphosphate pyrophosphatase family protein
MAPARLLFRIVKWLIIRNDGYPTFSRAYVLMKDTNALIDFHAGYDGHVFRSKTGRSTFNYAELFLTTQDRNTKLSSSMLQCRRPHTRQRAKWMPGREPSRKVRQSIEGNKPCRR